MAGRRRRSSKKSPIDLLILTALTEEAQVVEAVMSRVAALQKERSGVRFFDYPIDGATACIAVASAHQMGAVDMGVFAAPLLQDLKPRAAVLVGIAAAIDGMEVALGDVPLASQVLKYDDISVDQGVLTFRTDGFQVDPGMRRSASELQTLPTAYRSWQDEL